MTFAVEFADTARNDLFGILEFITADNPRRGASFVDELESFICERLAIFPESGTRIGRHRFIFIVFRNYVAVYIVDEETRRVRVVLVTEGHRKWRSAFE
jgi:plasmid stabilization system protein ParE